MIYALVHYPFIDARQIDQLRRKYDPQIDLIEPHIPLMFPVPESVGEETLVDHLASVLSGWQPFLIHLHGLQISSDDHLFLLIQEGREKIIRLHDQIYAGPLADFRRKDLPFTPHLTLGVVSKNPTEHEPVLEEAKGLGIDHACLLDRLHLVKVNDERSKIAWSKEFSLTK